MEEMEQLEGKEPKWLIDKNEKTVYDYIKELDYTMVYAEDRVKFLQDLLKCIEAPNGEIICNDEWLKGYVASRGFVEQQIKLKSDFRSEDEPFSKGLEKIADYMIFPKFNNETDEELKNVSKNDMSKYKKNKVKEEIDYKESDVNSKAQKHYKAQMKQTITLKDLEDFTYLDNMDFSIKQLGKYLGVGLSKEHRRDIENYIEKYKGKKYLYQAKKIFSELKKEIIIMKEKLRGTIYFKRISNGSTEINFNEDTGYFLEDNFIGTIISPYVYPNKVYPDKVPEEHLYGAGDFVPLTENKIDLKNAKHVLSIIELYSVLKQNCADKPDSDMWMILNVLENMIESTDLTDIEKNILKYKIEGLTDQEICDILVIENNTSVSRKMVSLIYHKIPHKLVEKYKQSYEDWLYTYKVKGVYKKCSRCKDNKLATHKHFSPDKRNKDKLHSLCKVCRTIK